MNVSDAFIPIDSKNIRFLVSDVLFYAESDIAEVIPEQEPAATTDGVGQLENSTVICIAKKK